MDYKKHLKTPFWTSVISTVFFGIIIHLFGITNVLHNYDDISTLPTGYGTGLPSGRWFLMIMGDFARDAKINFNLPYVNGLLFIVFIAFSAGILTLIFKFNHRKSAVLTGLLLVSFPTVTSIMIFRFTAGYYGVALLLSVLAVWVIEKYKYGFFISVFCIAMAVGTYQAYLPLIIALFVLLLLKKTLEEDTTFSKILLKGLYYCATLIAGFLLYYGILQICLHVKNIELLDYKGISEMGALSIREIPSLIRQAYSDFLCLPFHDYCDIAKTGLLRAVYLISGVVSIVMIAVILIEKKKKIDSIIMTVLLCVLFPIAVNFITIMCPNSNIYVLMVISFVTVLFVPIILLEVIESVDALANKQKLFKATQKFAAVILLTAIVSYSYLANFNYTSMYYVNRQAENYLNAMVTQIRMTDDFDASMEWAFIGEDIEDPLFENPWKNSLNYKPNSNNIHLINAYSRKSWIKQYFGYNMPLAEEKTVEKLKNNETVKKMPCWPNDGSIAVVDGVVVIKLQNE